MLCNDHSRFLEIADVIYRLQLTVLKGVMERRSDNTWACFVVEVYITPHTRVIEFIYIHMIIMPACIQ